MSVRSQYTEKRESGKMMYGPGCCANKITDAQVSNAKSRRMQEWQAEGNWLMVQNMRGRQEYPTNQGVGDGRL